MAVVVAGVLAEGFEITTGAVPTNSVAVVAAGAGVMTVVVADEGNI